MDRHSTTYINPTRFTNSQRTGLCKEWILWNRYQYAVVISPTYQRFLKPLKSCDIVKNDDDITSFPFSDTLNISSIGQYFIFWQNAPISTIFDLSPSNQFCNPPKFLSPLWAAHYPIHQMIRPFLFKLIL
jgi:hypothetical protein